MAGPREVSTAACLRKLERNARAAGGMGHHKATDFNPMFVLSEIAKAMLPRMGISARAALADFDKKGPQRGRDGGSWRLTRRLVQKEQGIA